MTTSQHERVDSGWPADMPRIQRLRIAAAYLVDRDAWALLQGAHGLAESTGKQQLVAALSLQLIESGCRLDDGRRVGSFEMDHSSDGMALVRLLALDGTEVHTAAVDAKVADWVANLSAPELVVPGADPGRGPYLVHLTQPDEMYLGQYWGPRGDIAVPPGHQPWDGATWIADAFFPRGGALPGERHWAEIEAMLGYQVSRVDEFSAKPLTKSSLYRALRRSLVLGTEHSLLHPA